MISDFKEFNEDLILESLNESILYFSPKMIEYLEDCEGNVSDELLRMKGTDTGIDMTFVDVDDMNPGFVTFYKMQTAKEYVSKKFNSEYMDKYHLSDEYANIVFMNSIKGQEKGRYSIRLGRFVNKMTKEKFSSSEIELFVNRFKAKSNSDVEEFILVDGEDIEKWYKRENSSDGIGSLQGSCMANKHNIFKLYTKNPQSCRLLVLLQKGKAIGRALVWKVHKSNIPMEYFMDRVYFTNEYQTLKFVDYARKMKWGIRNNHHSNKIEINGNSYSISDIGLEVKVKPGNYGKYPYLDTMSIYDPSTGILSSHASKKNKLYLSNTDGGYSDNRSRARRIISRFGTFFTA